MWRYRRYWTGGGWCGDIGYIGLEVERVEIQEHLDWRWRVWRYKRYWTGCGGCGDTRYIALGVEEILDWRWRMLKYWTGGGGCGDTRDIGLKQDLFGLCFLEYIQLQHDRSMHKHVVEISFCNCNYVKQNLRKL